MSRRDAAGGVEDMAPYDRIAPCWAQGRSAGGFREAPYVEAFAKYLEPASHVLDLGCGHGRPIMEALLDRGLQVTGLDRSLAMLALARESFPSGQLIAGDLLALPLEARFDGAIAWDSLFHIPRDHHGQILQRLGAMLRPGSPALFSWGGSAGEFTAPMFGQTFFFSGFSPRRTAELVRAAGFEILVYEVDDPSSRGHMAMLCRKGI